MKVEVFKRTVAFRSAYSHSNDIHISDVMVTCNPKIKESLAQSLRAVFPALQVTFLTSHQQTFVFPTRKKSECSHSDLYLLEPICTINEKTSYMTEALKISLFSLDN